MPPSSSRNAAIAISETALQRNAPFPFLAHCRQHRPGNLALLTSAVDIRAHRTSAVRIGAADPKAHACGDVCCRPMRGPIGGDCGQRRRVPSVGVGAARPDMPLVEMGVDVGKAWPYHATVEIDRRAFLAGAGWRNPHDPAAFDGKVEPHGLAISRIRLRLRQQRPRPRCIAQHIGRLCGEYQCRHLRGCERVDRASSYLAPLRGEVGTRAVARGFRVRGRGWLPNVRASGNRKWAPLAASGAREWSEGFDHAINHTPFRSRGRQRSRATCAAARIRAPTGRKRSRCRAVTSAEVPRTCAGC